jgi:hypothetical protein
VVVQVTRQDSPRVLLIVMVRNSEHAWTDRAEFPS